ncbi:MAG: (1-_4)-alpha-D-glucan 1-alpha-D-glucosylmutase [Solirubrobacteraceae bacterium]|nr:(1->4)-alpha-D-glucan 1-alpha-D-glucosylmutase [Solirubrobacteraceae bacterium]
MAALRATYRLQLGPGMGFGDVRALVPYLRDLGVSHLYLSPSLQARSGSTHGYDVVDPTRVSQSLGGEEGLRALSAEGLGIILDIVPNHMGTGDENRWWADEAERVRVFDVDPETGHYRRFFDIDDLAGVRVEDPEVFELTHAKVLSLLADGVIDGLRIDHPDGLADPAAYLDRLADAGAEHVWVEKILSHSHPPEALRDWPVEGTVGYEFLNDVQGVFIDPAGEAPLTALWHELSGDERSFDDVALEAQLQQATTTFTREVDRLRRIHDPGELEEALARLPVYRTYVRDGIFEDADREALAAAGRPELFDDAPAEFVSRFQQTSPPVTAKGIEDTAFYRYLRLLALNDVGGDPGRWGISVADFHAANLARAERFPRNLLVTQTHDTKRSGDARARIGALSAIPEQWAEHVRRWYELTEELVVRGAPDAAERYLVFQTLAGVWPIARERLEGYLEKALREAKRNTSWVDQDHDWEERVKAFAVALLDHRPFLEDFEPFAARLAAAGERSALGQLLLKLTVPGLPDVYQGDELADLSLVDPDNRRPVDWDARRTALAELRAGAPPTRETMKLHLISRALDLRARRPEVFEGAYTPLGARADVCAFARGDGDGEGDVVVVVPLRSSGEGAAVAIPEGRWRDALSGAERDLDGPVSVAQLTEPHGLALLERV